MLAYVVTAWLRQSAIRQNVVIRKLGRASQSRFHISSIVSSVPQSQNSAGPLQGLKVLDLTRVLAGPFCTQLLADYGADVIKIEQPGVGDETRSWKNKAEAAMWNTENMSLYFAAVNRNKRSMTLDLKKQKDLEVLYKLVEVSDVLIENLIPGKTDSLGISYDKLSRINPRIIHASISGYGNTGPYATRAGYDAIAAAEGGLMHITGFPGSPPSRPGLGMVDMSTGMLTHGAILAALYNRNSTGRGQHISASLFESQLAVLTNVGTTWLNTGVEGQRWGAAHPQIVPYNIYQTKEGAWFCIGANSDRQFKILCDRLQKPELSEDLRFATNTSRVEHRELMDGMMSDFMKQRTTAEWLAVLEGSGLAHGPVNSIEAALTHPQAQAREMVQTVKCNEIDGGNLKVIGPPIKFSDTRAQIRTRAPLLGEHNDQIMKELRIPK